jgi:hypothetical protein
VKIYVESGKNAAKKPVLAKQEEIATNIIFSKLRGCLEIKYRSN